MRKELPNWRGLDTDGVKMSTESKASFRRRLADFLSTKSKPQKKGPQTVPRLMKYKLANKWALLATDHALQAGVGSGLQDLVSTSTCVRLGPDEERYFVDNDALSTSVVGAAPDMCRRSCIHDASTGRTRLEASWSVKQRTFVMHSDMGSATWPAKLWLVGNKSKPLNGWIFPDPSHRRHNNFVLALQKSQLSFLRAEALLVCNLGSGPWAGAGHYCKYAEAIEEYVENYAPTDALFMSLYNHLAFDESRGWLGPEVGADAHISQLWNDLASSRQWVCKGETAKSGRWFQFTRRWSARRSGMSQLLMALLYVGLHAGFWLSLQSSPLGMLLHGADAIHIAELTEDIGKRLSVDADEGEPLEKGCNKKAASSSGHRDPSRSVAAYNAGDEKNFQNKNSLFLAASVLGNGVHVALLDAVCWITSFVDKEHGQLLKDCKTSRGSVNVHESRASGCWPHLGEIVGATRDLNLLVFMGVVSSSRPDKPWRAISAADLESIASSMIEFVQHLLGYELLDCMADHVTFPGAFARLLRSEDEHLGHLEYARSVWEAITDAEDSGDQWVCAYVDSLVWPLNPMGATDLRGTVRNELEDSATGRARSLVGGLF